LKTGLGFVQCHWKWHRLIDHIRVPIFTFHSNYGDILYRLRNNSDLLVENRAIFIPNLHLAPPQGVTQSEFREDV